MAVNEEKMNELLGRFLNDFGGTFHSAMAVIGDRLGLYKAMARRCRLVTGARWV